MDVSSDDLERRATLRAADEIARERGKDGLNDREYAEVEAVVRATLREAKLIPERAPSF